MAAFAVWRNDRGMGDRYLLLVWPGCAGAAGVAEKDVRAGDFQRVFG